MKRTVSSLLLILLVSLSLVWPAAIKSRAQTTKTTAPQTQTALAGDRAWPRGYSLPSEAQIVIFQPQVATWGEQKHLVALAAVSYIKKDEQKPAMGTIKLEADTSVALAERLVKFSTIKITETNFPTLSKEQTQEIVRLAATGHHNKEIAETLNITEGTVKVHLHNVYEKLGIEGQVELTISARDHGWV